nr:MlrC C-terminal domain-containing protein [Jannaschia sp. Os4]
MASVGPGGPVVIADVADNPGGGGTSDTMGVIRALIAQGARDAVAGLVHAPDAASRAAAEGVGAAFDLRLGAAAPWPGDAPLDLAVEVGSVSDAPIRYVGEMYGGGHAAVGRSAVLRVRDPGCDLRVVVTEIPSQALDRGFFLHHGIDPAELAVVALKSSVHYRADFGPIARAIVEADAPGRLPADPSTLPFRHLRPGLRRAPER